MTVTAASTRILARRARHAPRGSFPWWHRFTPSSLWLAWDAATTWDEDQCVRYGRTEQSARRRAALAMNRRDRKAQP